MTTPFIELATQVEPWFGNPGLTGAFVGGGVGCLGGVYGTVAGILAPQGKCRGLVLGIHWFAVALGVVLLVTGVTALVLGQPYAVWFPMLLAGGVATLVVLPMTPLLRLRYRQAEQRRLEAEEFRQS